MSRLDDIERRIAELEREGVAALSLRIRELEAILGVNSDGSAPKPTGEAKLCGRCGMNQTLNSDFKCAQTKCPLK